MSCYAGFIATCLSLCKQALLLASAAVLATANPLNKARGAVPFHTSIL